MSATQNQTNGNDSTFRLTRVWARNFKSIRNLDLELDPLTVLVGPNASGKSNILDILAFIKQAIGRDLDSAIAARHGIEAIRRTSPGGGNRDIELGFELTRSNFRMRYRFVLGSRSGVYRVKREYGTVTPLDPEKKLTEFVVREGRVVKPNRLANEEFGTSELALPFLARYLFRLSEENADDQHISHETYREVSGVLSFIRRMQFYRLFPDAMREPKRPMDSRLLVEDGSNLASVLRAMTKRNSRFLDEIKDSLGHVVSGMENMVVQQSGGYSIVKLWHKLGNYGNEGAWFDLSQESDGTVRLLGLLTAFYQDLPNSLIGVEEPELTIHPGALAVLAEVMVEASYRSQVVATTHSPDLIDRLPIESLRAVEMRDGCTEVGPVSKIQTNAVLKGLFSAGELHSMEGLAPRR